MTVRKLINELEKLEDDNMLVVSSKKEFLTGLVPIDLGKPTRMLIKTPGRVLVPLSDYEYPPGSGNYSYSKDFDGISEEVYVI